MSFLKTKGQVEMNRQMMQQSQFSQKSPERKASQNAIGNGMIIPFQKQIASDDFTLEFDSVFESGNLAVAIKVSENEYNLILQNDINTNGHTQWFYFKVKSKFKKRTAVKFNLINLYKPKSLYQYGMRVLTLDVSKPKDKEPEGNNEKQEKTKEKSPKKVKRPPMSPMSPVMDDPEILGLDGLPKWRRSCRDVCYTQNKFTNEQCPTGLYEVQFIYDFDQGEKEIYFSHSVPYTYSMLTDYLNSNVSKDKAKRQTLCHSLAGNKVEYLYITSKPKKIEPPTAIPPIIEQEILSSKLDKDGNLKSSSPLKKQKSLTKKKKNEIKPFEKQVILLTSRVHPGETNASWMIQGLMDTLLKPEGKEEEELVKNLKDHFEIYVIPMLNVDGVINGNYRCSLASCDLNRKWIKPSKSLHPTVYYTKKLCQQLTDTDKKSFFLYLDFHGHSAKKNIFQYGNKTEMWGASKQKPSSFLAPSVFPLMVSRQFDYFNFPDCTFNMPKNKESTARITMFHKLRIPFVFTLEASFAGASKGQLSGKHFSVRDLLNVGKYVLKAIWEVKKLELNKNLLKQITDEAKKQAKSNEDGEDSDGCSSSEEEGEAASKKQAQIIQDQELSPSPKRVGEQTLVQGSQPIRKDTAGEQCSKSKGIKMEPMSATKNPKSKQSVMNIKSVQGTLDAGNMSKSNSPRKNEGRQPERIQGSILQPVRRSIRPSNFNTNMSNSPERMVHEQGHMMQGIQGGESPQMRNQTEPQQFDLIKNLVKTQNPDDNIEVGGDNQNIEALAQQQELFEQFNKEIKRSFAEQQHHLDEIFLKTAKKFLDLQNGNSTSAWQNMSQRRSFGGQNTRQAHMGQSAGPSNWGKPPPHMSEGPQFNSTVRQGGVNNNSFLDQFLQQQRINSLYEKQRSTQGIQDQLLSQLQQQLCQQNIGQLPLLNENLINPIQQQQMQTTFLYLQKLHQMQKINQMAQMQFFRQQAELLLSQNLTQQQQWELFQQFSYYQAQIQMQNQQYQLIDHQLKQAVPFNQDQLPLFSNLQNQQQQQESSMQNYPYMHRSTVSQPNEQQFQSNPSVQSQMSQSLHSTSESPLKTNQHRRFVSSTVPQNHQYHSQQNSQFSHYPTSQKKPQQLVNHLRGEPIIGERRHNQQRKVPAQQLSHLAIQNLAAQGFSQSEWQMQPASQSQIGTNKTGSLKLVQQSSTPTKQSQRPQQESNNYSEGLLSNSSSKFKHMDMKAEKQTLRNEDYHGCRPLNHATAFTRNSVGSLDQKSNYEFHSSPTKDDNRLTSQIEDQEGDNTILSSIQQKYIQHIEKNPRTQQNQSSLKQQHRAVQNQPHLRLKQGFEETKTENKKQDILKQIQQSYISNAQQKLVKSGLLSPTLPQNQGDSKRETKMSQNNQRPHHSEQFAQSNQEAPHIFSYHPEQKMSEQYDQQMSQQLLNIQFPPSQVSHQTNTQKFFSTRGARQKSKQYPIKAQKKQNSFKSAKYPFSGQQIEQTQVELVPSLTQNMQTQQPHKIAQIQQIGQFAGGQLGQNYIPHTEKKMPRDAALGQMAPNQYKSTSAAKPTSQSIHRGNTTLPSDKTNLFGPQANISRIGQSRHQTSTIQQNRQNIDQLFQEAEQQKHSKFSQEADKIDQYITKKNKERHDGQFNQTSVENSHHSVSRGMEQKGFRKQNLQSQQANYKGI